MKFFDRYAKLKKAVPETRLIDNLKDMMPLLRGNLEKADLPELIVEPANRDELQRIVEFAIERDMRISIGSGISPSQVRNLSGQMLILTSRLCAPPQFNKNNSAVRADAGLPVEAFTAQLAARGSYWRTLHPVLSGSLGSLIAKGFEGLRNFRDGSTLAHVPAVEWLGFDGKFYYTGAVYTDSGIPDVSGAVFGSRGKFGIITSLDLSLSAVPETRTMLMLELQSQKEAEEILIWLRNSNPQPESVVYWGETATDILRRANDGTVSDHAKVILTVEWDQRVNLDSEWKNIARVLTDEKEISRLWQDLFRLPRAAARLAPHRTTGKFKLPVSAIADIEERAAELARENNMDIAMWGTTDYGHMHIWVLQQDGELRSDRIASVILTRLMEDAVRLGGCVVDASIEIHPRFRGAAIDSISSQLEQRLLEKCDPNQRFIAR